MPSTIFSAMPAHYEMLVSHSSPIYSQSPPAGFLSDYGPSMNRYFDPSRSLCRSQSFTPIQTRQKMQLALKKTTNVPKRPCLVIKTNYTDENTTQTNEHSEHDSSKDEKAKKKVVFADDKGRSLTEVRIMSEPSSVPPLWSIEFLSHVTQGLISPEITEEWTITFRQPASDYLNFRQKLDTKNVSLENVIVKENESMLVGTVKVKNLNFEKEVIVRLTWDDWKTTQDTFCTYSTIGGSGGSYVIFDTFSFKLNLPPSSNKIEFCVCYRSNDQEFWDNNDGKNYVIYKNKSSISSHASGIRRHNSAGSIPNSQSVNIPRDKYTELTQSKMTSYSEFASWNHLDNESPYW